jgi:uncharacterized protein
MSTPTRSWRIQRSMRIAGVASTALALAVGLDWTPLALGIGLDQIPSPRPSGWTVDLTGRVPSETVKALDNLGNEIQKQTGAELAVVVIGSTEGADPHRFANALFNRWKIGQAGKNNGVLLFAALDDRKSEIILGDGIDDPAHVATSRQIMQEILLPRFKAGDPGGAVFRGARACAEQILAVKLDPLQAEAPIPAEPKPVAAPAPAAVQPARLAAPPAGARPAMPAVRQRPHTGIGWVFGGIAVAGVVMFGARKFLRYHARRCTGCRGNMTRLGEAADDEYLTPGERTEERLGSVDYDVWACGTCGKTLKFRHGALFTRYSRCPKCRAKTKSTTKRTIRAATYSRGGLVEVEELCHACSYRHNQPHSTPMITNATAASTAMWSSPGSSSAPPSVNTGFSGGHSSGGGASGGW